MSRWLQHLSILEFLLQKFELSCRISQVESGLEGPMLWLQYESVASPGPRGIVPVPNAKSCRDH